MFTVASIARRFGLNDLQKDRLRKRLENWCGPSNLKEWTEVRDRNPRQPRIFTVLEASDTSSTK